MSRNQLTMVNHAVKTAKSWPKNEPNDPSGSRGGAFLEEDGATAINKGSVTCLSVSV